MRLFSHGLRLLGATIAASASLLIGNVGDARAAVPGPPTYVTSPFWVATSKGAVWALNNAPNFGGVPPADLPAPVVAMVPTADGHGYWLATSRGNVYGFGDAHWYGSTAARALTSPITGMAADPATGGYWLYSAQGNVYNFNAPWRGSAVAAHASSPVVGMTLDPSSGGYWLATAGGNVFPFGGAHWHGSPAGARLSSPIVGLAAQPTGQGYWLYTASGRILNYGAAPWYGSVAGASAAGVVAAGTAAAPVEKVVPTWDGQGYWEITANGDSYAFGNASKGGTPGTALVLNPLTHGQQALAFAMSQLGKPYQWGGTGPNSYDCSGLTEVAWSNAGVWIPRVADSQYINEAKVPLADLAPGDLVFWASNVSSPTTIYHVALYLGGGHMVHSPTTGQTVSTNWIGGPGFVNAAVHP